jgi:hypothetical protein
MPARADGPDRKLRLRAAIASAFLGGPELTGAEALVLGQDSARAENRVNGRHDGVAAAATVTGPAG